MKIWPWIDKTMSCIQFIKISILSIFETIYIVLCNTNELNFNLKKWTLNNKNRKMKFVSPKWCFIWMKVGHVIDSRFRVPDISLSISLSLSLSLSLSCMHLRTSVAHSILDKLDLQIRKSSYQNHRIRCILWTQRNWRISLDTW